MNTSDFEKISHFFLFKKLDKWISFSKLKAAASWAAQHRTQNGELVVNQCYNLVG